MTQYARPVSDVENPGGWATEPLWDKLDEEPFDDGDFIESPKSSAGDSFTIGLSPVIDPGVHTDHIVRIRAKVGVAGVFRYEFLQGAVVIKDSGEVVLGTTTAEHNMMLTEEEAGNISDYGAFRLRVTTISTQKNQRQDVSWIQVDVPDMAGEEHSGSGSISGNGSVVGVIKKGGLGSALASAGGTLLALGLAGMLGIASIAGGGSQLGTGEKAVSGTVSISGGGSQLVVGEKSSTDSIAISGAGSIIATGEKSEGEAHSGVAVVSGNGGVDVAVIKQALADLAISGNGGLNGAGTKQAPGDSTIVGGGSIVAVGTMSESHSGVAIVSEGGVIDGNGLKQTPGNLVMAGGGFLVATGYGLEAFIEVVKTVFLKSKLTERLVELKSTIKPLIVLDSEIKPEGEE